MLYRRSDSLMNFYFLYKLTLLNTEKVYIGYTNDLNRRLYDHIKQLELGVHPNEAMQKDYISGRLEIDVLESYFNVNQSFIQEREKSLIEDFDSFNNGYNQTPGGEGNLTYREFNRDKIIEAYAILKSFPEKSSAVVQEIFSMSESSVLRLKNKQSYISTLSIYEKMSQEQKNSFLGELEQKYSLRELFEKHDREVRYKSRSLDKEQIFYIISIYENCSKKGAIMERKLNLPSSHSSRIGRGLRYKDYYSEFQDKSLEEKKEILFKAKEYFNIK